MDLYKLLRIHKENIPQGLTPRDRWAFTKGKYNRSQFAFQGQVMNDDNAIQIIEDLERIDRIEKNQRRIKST